MSRRRSSYLAGLLAVLLIAQPAWARVVFNRNLASGTTPISGGTDTQVCYNDVGVLRCGDAGLVFDEAANKLTAGALAVSALTSGKLPKAGTGGLLADSLLSDDGTDVTLTSGQFLAPDGTEALPSLAFAGEPSLGFHKKTTRELGVSINGKRVAWFSLKDGDTTNNIGQLTIYENIPGSEGPAVVLDGQAGSYIDTHFRVGASGADGTNPIPTAITDAIGNVPSISTYQNNGTSVLFHARGANASAAQLYAFKNRSTDAQAPGLLATSAVIADDVILRLGAYGADGTNYSAAGRMDITVDGTPGLNDMPGRIVFSTTPDGSSSPVERLRITSAGVILGSTTGRYASTPQAVTCADSGDGNPGALTITPAATYIEVTNSDANGCNVTMGEGSAVVGELLVLAVVSSAGGTVNFADSAGVSEIAGAYNAAINDTIAMVYGNTATYREWARSNN